MDHDSPFRRSESWDQPPANIVLPPGEIHVWYVSLEVGKAHLARLQGLLLPDELRRAADYHFNRDRRRFIVRRAALRDIIGWYLGVEPRRLRFAGGPHGKPALAPSVSKKSVQFNLAHSGEVALIALALDCEVGIDIERQRKDVACADLAERYFSPDEAATLRALPQEEQSVAFFRLWTCKEAYLKGIGTGLVRALDGFSVSLTSTESRLRLDEGDRTRPLGEWTLKELRIAPSYWAALAVNRKAWRLRCLSWPGASHLG